MSWVWTVALRAPIRSATTPDSGETSAAAPDDAVTRTPTCQRSIPNSACRSSAAIPNSTSMNVLLAIVAASSPPSTPRPCIPATVGSASSPRRPTRPLETALSDTEA